MSVVLKAGFYLEARQVWFLKHLASRNCSWKAHDDHGGKGASAGVHGALQRSVCAAPCPVWRSASSSQDHTITAERHSVSPGDAPTVSKGSDVRTAAVAPMSVAGRRLPRMKQAGNAMPIVGRKKSGNALGASRHLMRATATKRTTIRPVERARRLARQQAEGGDAHASWIRHGDRPQQCLGIGM